MNATTTDSVQYLTSCAVCKIDLKGRFVFIDDRFERMLGPAKEELFGKSVVDFLDGDSRKIIEELLNNRNHYETFFETVRVSFQNTEGVVSSHQMVVSLNFIGGNPVNYQLICLPETTPVDSTNNPTPEPESTDPVFVNELIHVWQNPAIESFIRLLLRQSQAERVALYVPEESSLVETFSEASPAVAAQTPSLPELTSMHYDLFNNQGAYTFVFNEDVKSALEIYTEAPNEIIRNIVVDDTQYLLRMIYTASDNPSAPKTDAALCDLLTGLLYDRNEDSSFGPDIKFTVGFLDTLQIPAVLIDKEGTVVGYNPSVQPLFTKEALSGSYVNLLQSIKEYVDEKVYTGFLDYISSSINDASMADYRFQLAIPDKGSYSVTLLKLSDHALDLTSCLIFLPILENDEAIVKTSNLYPPIPNDDSYFSKIASDIPRILENDPIPELQSLKELIQETTDEYVSAYPDRIIQTVCRNIPAMAFDRARWQLFLNLLFALAIGVNRKKIDLTIRGKKQDNQNVIEIQLAVPKGWIISLRHCRIFDFVGEQLGWSMSIQFKEAQKVCFIITECDQGETV